jgi:quinolinate synthase
MTAVLPALAPKPLDPAERSHLRAEIARLRVERKAVILAHYYQEADVQDVADFVGDSLQLAQQAAKTDAHVIAFAGVHFMAETAKILNPKKRVVIPDLEAGCSLDDSAPAAEFEKWVKAHPGHVVVSYINCSAAVKALSDVICTSSNAEKVVRSVPADTPILFAPDQHLGAWLVKKTGRKMTLWPGRCMVHDAFDVANLQALIDKHPDAEVIAHPECPADVLELADYVGSTTGLISRVKSDPKRTYILGTEAGILHEIHRQVPDANVIPLPPSRSNVLSVATEGREHGCACAVCPHMKRNTLRKLWLCLRDMTPEIDVAPDVAAKARRSVERMLEISR